MSLLLMGVVESLLASLGIMTPYPQQENTGLLAQGFSFEDKAQRIEDCLARSPVNLWELRELALSKGGLLERE
jgi:hypothetical protein